MSISWQRMTVEEFAQFERISGKHIMVVNDVHWLQVRRLFFRPLLPYKEYPPDLVRSPALSWLGGFQHACRRAHPPIPF